MIDTYTYTCTYMVEMSRFDVIAPLMDTYVYYMPIKK